MIEIKNLTHSFGEKILYKDVSININGGEKIGLVGFNGTGKTTFINILTGNIVPEKGDIVYPKNLKVGYLDQFVNVDKSLTVEEYLKTAFDDLYKLEKEYNNLTVALQDCGCDEQKMLNKMQNIFDTLLEKDFYEIPTKINQIASGLGISKFGMETVLKDLSGGQKMKVILAKILLQKPDFLILDEPTNYLDTNHIEWFTKFLNKFEGNVLIVSHDVMFLDGVINTVWSIENKQIVRYNGNYTSFLKQKALNEKAEERRIENIKKEREKLEEYIAKNKVRTATARQAKSREKRLEKLEVIDEKVETPEPSFCFKYKHNPFTSLIVVRNLCAGYSYPLIKNFNLTMQNGERIRLKGFNGVGKTTLLKTIQNIIPKLSGTINYYGKSDIAYFDQEIVFDDMKRTPLQEILSDFPELTEREARGMLSRVGLTAKHIMEPIKSLSGGEMCKLKLCKLMKNPHTILVLDEVTSHLDVKAKASLARAVNNFQGLVLLVSHEEDFVNQIKNVKEIEISSFKVE